MTDKIAQDLEQIFAKSAKPLRLAILFNSSELNNFDCLYSTNPLYKKHDSLSVYNIPPLLRTLINKNKVLCEKEVFKLYDNSPCEVCYIHEWNDQSRKVFIFNFDELDFFDANSFDTNLKQNKISFDKIFQKVYYAFFHSRSKEC